MYTGVMAREKISDKKARAERIYRKLTEAYPDVTCTLNFDGAWELLVGGILGAQCTDERVNIITADLFVDYPELEDYVNASQEEIEEAIRSCGLFRNKAKSLRGSAQMILEDFDGEVPDNMKDLLKLPGVGRKVANLVLSDYFGVPAIVVDTHNGRISRDLGLVKAKDPAKVEKELQKLLKPEHWTHWGHLMVHHGRVCCTARSKTCLLCPVSRDCAFAEKHKEELSEALAEGDVERGFKD